MVTVTSTPTYLHNAQASTSCPARSLSSQVDHSMLALLFLTVLYSEECRYCCNGNYTPQKKKILVKFYSKYILCSSFSRNPGGNYLQSPEVLFQLLIHSQQQCKSSWRNREKSICDLCFATHLFNSSWNCSSFLLSSALAAIDLRTAVAKESTTVGEAEQKMQGWTCET